MTHSRGAALLAILATLLAACARDAATTQDPQTTMQASPTESPELSSLSAEPTPQPSVAAGPPTIAWEPAEAFEGVTEVYADGDMWIAGGFVDGPAAWTSKDARTWTRSDVENQQPHETFGGPQLGPMDRLGDSLLSFGTMIGCCDGRGVYGWRSADGASWQAIESTSPLFEEGYLVMEVAAGSQALVAVENGYVAYVGRLWTWTEATSWVETTPGAASGTFSDIQLHDVVWSQDRFVAVGERSNGGDRIPPTGTSWVSTDGGTWEASVPTAAMQGVRLSAVAPLPEGGFVAIGSLAELDSPASTSVAFTSSDGLSWTAVPEPFPDSAIGYQADLVEVPGGLVAFSGSDVWATDDGLSWMSAGSLDAPFVAAAAMDDKIVVFTAGSEHRPRGIQRGVIDD